MFKRATALFAEQEAKDAGERLSAEKLQHIVDSEYGKGMSPTVRSIQRIVKAGIIGVSPVKPGKKSDLHDFTFKALVGEVETFTVISQINGQSSRTTARFLSVKTKKLMETDVECSTKLLERVLREATFDLLAHKCSQLSREG